jgi:peptide/nickel transport system ATP-binding protein
MSADAENGGVVSAADHTPLLEVENLVVRYAVARGMIGAIRREPRRSVHAVEGVSFSVRQGQMVALVGESGCGKTTTAQAVLRLVPATSGTIKIDGTDVSDLSGKEMRPFRRRARQRTRCDSTKSVCSI